MTHSTDRVSYPEADQAMRISIACCTYNGEAFIAQQLKSFSEQTSLPFELVICDDQSTDGTVALLEDYAANAPFPVRIYVNDSRLGITRNFEQAIRLCEGEVIALSDQDDVWSSTKSDRIREALQNHPQAGVVFTDAEVVDARLMPAGYSLWESIGFSADEQKRVAHGQAAGVLARHNVMTGATMAFRAQLRDRFLPIPDAWLHDAWIAWMACLNTGLLPLPEPLIQYRQHANNQIGTPAADLSTRVRHAFAYNKAHQEQIYAAYAVLEKRIRQDFGDAHALLPLVRAQMNHRHARATLPQNRAYRIPVIARELITRRYHRFSSGFYGAAKDFLA